MKYGKYLLGVGEEFNDVIPEDLYVNYKQLKKLLKRVLKANNGSEEWVALRGDAGKRAFFDFYHAEVKKVVDFIILCATPVTPAELEAATAKQAATATVAPAPATSDAETDTKADPAEADAKAAPDGSDPVVVVRSPKAAAALASVTGPDALVLRPKHHTARSAMAIQSYMDVNREAFRKILKKWDKNHNMRSGALLESTYDRLAPHIKAAEIVLEAAHRSNFNQPAGTWKQRCRAACSCSRKSLAIGSSVTVAAVAAVVVGSLIIDPSALDFLFALGVAASFMLAWANGANDIANSVGTSVGAGALTLRQAVIFGCLFEFLGSVTMGQLVSKTISKGVIEPSSYEANPNTFAVGMFAVLLGAGSTTLLATAYGYPISATHGIIGGLVAVGMAAKGPDSLGWGKLADTCISWAVSPAAGLVTAGAMYLVIHYAIMSADDPAARSDKLQPAFVVVTVAILVLFAVIKGPKVLKVEPLWLAVLAAIGVGVLVAVLHRAYQATRERTIRRKGTKKAALKGSGGVSLASFKSNKVATTPVAVKPKRDKQAFTDLDDIKDPATPSPLAADGGALLSDAPRSTAVADAAGAEPDASEFCDAPGAAPAPVPVLPVQASGAAFASSSAAQAPDSEADSEDDGAGGNGMAADGADNDEEEDDDDDGLDYTEPGMDVPTLAKRKAAAQARYTSSRRTSIADMLVSDVLQDDTVDLAATIVRTRRRSQRGALNTARSGYSNLGSVTESRDGTNDGGARPSPRAELAQATAAAGGAGGNTEASAASAAAQAAAQASAQAAAADLEQGTTPEQDAVEAKRVEADEMATVVRGILRAEKKFAPLLVISALTVAFAHGGNDVANAVGPLAAMLEVYNNGTVTGKPAIPLWALFLGAGGFVCGIATLGYKTIATVGTKITTLTPSKSFATQIGAAVAVLGSSVLGMPVSTSHCLVGSVVGIGLAQKVAGKSGPVNVKVLKRIFIGWVCTIPLAAGVAVLVFLAMKAAYPLSWGQ